MDHHRNIGLALLYIYVQRSEDYHARITTAGDGRIGSSPTRSRPPEPIADRRRLTSSQPPSTTPTPHAWQETLEFGHFPRYTRGPLRAETLVRDGLGQLRRQGLRAL